MSPATAGILSLVPAAVTIVVALATHRVAWALFFGVVAGGLGLGWMQAQAAGGAGFLMTGIREAAGLLHLSFTDLDRLKIALFVLLVGGLLEIISATGGYAAFAGAIGRSLRTPRRTRLTVFGLGLCMFFDDYASLLIAGSSMRPLVLSHGISPALFAYLVDQTAIVVSMVFLSTWAAYEGSLLTGAAAAIGRPASAGALLLDSLPFHLATIFGIWLAFLTARSGTWFGGLLDRPDAVSAPATSELPKGSIRHVLLPMGLLIGCSLTGLAGCALWNAHRLPPGEITLMALLGDVPTVSILLTATVLALVTELLQIRQDRLLRWKTIGTTFKRGLAGMVPAAMVIILARGLSEASSKLGTGQFLTEQLAPYTIPAVIPLLVFLISIVITVATGFNWSSMAIVMPVAFQMTAGGGSPDQIPMVSGAVISGSIAGGLLIPYSETSVMASSVCGISPIRHARTMAPQMLLVIAGSVVGYLLLGFGAPTIVGLLTPLVAITAIHSRWSR